MKNLKIFSLIVITIISCMCRADKADTIKELGQLLHDLSSCCGPRQMSVESPIARECRQKMDDVERLAAQLSYTQYLDALNWKRDRQTAIEVALEKSGVAQAIVLQKARCVAEFVVHDLKAGDLTRKEILQNPELAEKLDAFERAQFEEHNKDDQKR